MEKLLIGVLRPVPRDWTHHRDEELVSRLCEVRLHPPPSATCGTLWDMTVADTDSTNSGQPFRNRENDFQQPCRWRTARRVRSPGSEDVPQVRQNSFEGVSGEHAMPITHQNFPRSSQCLRVSLHKPQQRLPHEVVITSSRNVG